MFSDDFEPLDIIGFAQCFKNAKIVDLELRRRGAQYTPRGAQEPWCGAQYKTRVALLHMRGFCLTCISFWSRSSTLCSVPKRLRSASTSFSLC